MAHILVVDDSPVYRHLLTLLLKQWGFEVFEAENGCEALEVLRRHEIHLVISDWEMPVMDGVELCAQIRQQFTSGYIYLILVTVRQHIDDLRRGFEAGADDFISKPVDQGELRARLHAGMRILQLEETLAARNENLQQAYQQLENDLRAAAHLQHSVLPENGLVINGYQADYLFLPSAYVSGDVLGFFPLGEHHLGFYSVDVSGHGVSAAMLSLAVSRQFLHGRVTDELLFQRTESGCSITSPCQVVAALNRRFSSQGNDILSYFTLVYGVIDIESGEGTLCQAGHPTPFIVRANGEVETIGEGGVPIGLLDEVEYQDALFCLSPGDRLYIFTDGISECEDKHGVLFGTERLQQLLSVLTESDFKSVFAHVQSTLDDWRGAEIMTTAPNVGVSPSRFGDDVSLLAIQRLPNLLNED